MAGKREATRRDLTERLLAAATRRIEADGLARLRARDVTADAQCGLGTIYKCFADLDDLILQVSSTTLARLDAELQSAKAGVDDPEDQLVALAHAYLAFAVVNRNLWSALFEHQIPSEKAPGWLHGKLGELFRHVEGPLAEINPALSGTVLGARARSIFAAVHGVVTLSLEDRIVGLDPAQLQGELEVVVRAIARSGPLLPG